MIFGKLVTIYLGVQSSALFLLIKTEIAWKYLKRAQADCLKIALKLSEKAATHYTKKAT